MSLFEQKYRTTTRTIFGLSNTPFQDDVVLECDTLLGAVGIQLQSIPANYWSTQYKLYIVDKSNNASVNNITITAPFGSKINGASSVVISANGGSYLIRVVSNTNYAGQYSSGGGGVSGYSVIKDEGVALPSRSAINFVGGGVTASDVGGETQVTISGGVASVTNAQMLTLISTNSVIPGQSYLITNATYTNGGVIVQGVNNNSTTSIQGTGIFLNADYQGVGNYSGVSGFVAWKNIWCLPAIPVVIGDVVIWNNFHYKNLTGVWGTAPDTDIVNWVLLPKTITNGYILECDFIKYNLITNAIVYRADGRLNEVEFFNGLGGVNFLSFQWGRNLVSGNKVLNSSEIIATNSYCQIRNNDLFGGKLYDETNSVSSGAITLNKISQGGVIKLYQNQGLVTNNNVSGTKSSIVALGISKIINTGVQIANNSLSSGGGIVFDVAGAAISNNQISINSVIDAVLVTGIGVLNNNLTNYTSITTTTSITGFVSNSCNNLTINVPISAFESSSSFGYGDSTFALSLDFTDATIWDAFSQTLTIPSDRMYCGTFQLLNAGGVTINKIINMPQGKSKFIAVFPSSVTFQHTLISVATAGDLCCDAPSSANTITGRLNGDDYIEYQASGNVSRRTNLVLLA